MHTHTHCLHTHMLPACLLGCVYVCMHVCRLMQIHLAAKSLVTLLTRCSPTHTHTKTHWQDVASTYGNNDNISNSNNSTSNNNSDDVKRTPLPKRKNKKPCGSIRLGGEVGQSGCRATCQGMGMGRRRGMGMGMGIPRGIGLWGVGPIRVEQVGYGLKQHFGSAELSLLLSAIAIAPVTRAAPRPQSSLLLLLRCCPV